ncbi:RHS repeat-associated core domain-containing protein [Micromonospora zhanjiangensis]|uniref:RHS repeat-associated core domain-containing protein n=1 Tax=Micromonospora zhanjiangensis TaxID=1522057 RepID=A0ABV8KXB4_9ACTN
MASMLDVPPAVAKPTEPGPPPTSPGRSVKGVRPVVAKFIKPRDQAKDNYRPTKAAWPAASTADIQLSQPGAHTAVGAKSAAKGMPVWAQPVAAKDGRYTGPDRLKVRILDRTTTEAAGINGVLLSVTPAAATGSGTVRVGLDYAQFAEAYGGNYASRLQLVRLPECALTTPKLASCQAPDPLRSTNDNVGETVSADVPLTAPGQSAGGATVLAAVAGTGSSGGTYEATDLNPSGSWSGGGSTGSFTYSYGINIPPAASSLAPAVSLSYDSGSVDGQTASTQAQASWVGDGWSTPHSYVEQTFTSCEDNPEGSPSPVKTTDRCYGGPVLTLSLNGSSTALVWDNTKHVWKPEHDNGEVITRVTNSGNGSGTYNTDYWRVTLRNGSTYEFGRNRLPGWTSGKAETHSVDTVDVYSAHSGDPCFDSAGFSSSVCTMAYRWNLDYVKDVHGNAMAYYYKQNTNYYGRNKGTTDVSYVRDSYLDRIDYGFTDGNAYGTVPNQVVFNVGDRCLSGTCQPLNAANKANWPDVPFDLICARGTDCQTWSPSFFSTVRLTSIVTRQYSTTTSSYEAVDSYALSQTMPATGDGTSPTLWLSSIARTGSDTAAGGSASPITLPSVSFNGIKLQNRVDGVTDGLPALYRQRIETVTTETGSVITASYERPKPCTAPVTLNPATNTSSCYPVYWNPAAYTEPFRDWFNKYAVTRVTQTDPTGGAPATSTSYEYLGGAAWHFDDNEVVKAKHRTYGQFRGYARARAFTGDGVNDRRTMSEATYYRGMSKNNNATVVNITDSAGGEHEDLDQLAGRELEATVYLGEGGPVDNSAITSYWVSAATATRDRTGVADLTSHVVAPVKTYSRQAITGSGATTWRYTEADQSYDANIGSPTFGLVQRSYTHTVPVDSAYDQCTTYNYAPGNASKNLIGLISETESVSVACGGFIQGRPASMPGSINTLTAPASVNRPAQVVSDQRTYYDDETFSTTFPQASTPTRGLVTMSRDAVDWTGGAYIYQTTGRAKFDSYGRPIEAYDGNGNMTSTKYETNSVGLVTGATATNPLGHTASASINPKRGKTRTSTDANGVAAIQEYDALGRATSVWLNSRPTSATADYRFSYQLLKTGATAVTTLKLNDSLGHDDYTTIYDAMLRPRQTQSITPQNGRMISDTFYDSRGWVAATYNGWWDDGSTPNTTLVSAPDLKKAVPNQTFPTYDGLGRSVITVKARNGLPVSTTTTVYNGDRTTVIPPTGGVTKTSVTDPLGRATELQEYTAAPTVNTPADTFTGVLSVTGGTTAVTRYGYDGHGNQATLTDAGSNTWTSTYNLLGQVTSKADPDTGNTTMAYDGNGNLLQSTDARGKTVSYTYDKLNRKTGAFFAPVGSQSAANQSASWVYDNTNNVPGVTYPIGRLTTATSYSGGQPYITQQKGFNVFGNSLGVTVTIPDTEGLLGGSYAFTHTYTSNLGLPLKDGYPNKGNLPAETVLHGYAGGALNLPTTLGGLSGYTQNVSYDAYGRVNQQTIGGTPGLAYVTNTFDDHDSRLTKQLVTHATDPKNVDEQAYRYDLAGNVIKKTSTRLGAATPAETQCYEYDKLARLTQAWTATDDCAATPTGGNSSMVGNALGDGSAYWTSWQLDLLGNRKQQVEHNLAGGTDTTTNYTYDGASRNQPHTLTSTATTGGASGSTSYSYDPAGNTVTRSAGKGNQNLAWDDAGRLTGITGGAAGNSSYVYDSDGALLLQKDPGQTILYLPGQQLTLDTKFNTVSGTRYYALPGGGTCIRTGSGSNYTFALPDPQGTPSLYLDNTAQTPTWRQYTPYGAPRGAAALYPDNHGFLDKPTSPDTGLTMVGVRAYDPAIGRFVSVDPIQDLADPQQWNGYAYANNSPVTLSDPSGLSPEDAQWEVDHPHTTNTASDDPGWGKYGCPDDDCTARDSNGKPARFPVFSGKNGTTVTRDASGNYYLNGYRLPKAKFDVVQLAAILDSNRDQGRLVAAENSADAVVRLWALLTEIVVACSQVAACNDSNGSFYTAVDQDRAAAEQIRKSNHDGRMSWQQALIEMGMAVPLMVGTNRFAGTPGMLRPKGCRNSFDPDTLVLMADGSTKAIKDVKVGDKVLASDPSAGGTTGEEVTQLHANQDTDLTDVTVFGAGGWLTILYTTTNHLFWDVTTREWTSAGALRPGDLLRTGDGRTAQVAAVRNRTERHEMLNLTVSQLHTYYVLAGNTPVLVHNDGCGRSVAKYEDITDPNSRIANRLTDVGPEEFADTLISNGWSRSVSKDGSVQIFQKGGAKYALRGNARTYDGWTAEFTPAGSRRATLKIRLGG